MYYYFYINNIQYNYLKFNNLDKYKDNIVNFDNFKNRNKGILFYTSKRRRK